MPSRSRLVRWRQNYPPLDQVRVKCAVCGFPLDPDRTQSPEETPTVYQVAGTTYFAKTAAGELDLPAMDLTVFPNVPAFAACPFCGSPRWMDGEAGMLRR